MPERVAAIQRLSTSFLRSALYPGDPAFSDTAPRRWQPDAASEGSVETK